MPSKENEPGHNISAQVDQSLRCPPEYALDRRLPTERPADSDQTAHMRKLIYSLGAHAHLVGNDVPRLKCYRH